MATRQKEWTPNTIFAVVAEVLTDSLGLDDESEVKLESNIMTEFGAESIDMLDVAHRLEGHGIKIRGSDISPSYSNIPDLSKLLRLDQACIDQIAGQFEGIDTSHLKPGGTVEDLYTVSFLCQVVAKKLNVAWPNGFVPA